MKRLVVLAVALVTALSASAQQADGGISEAMLQNIRQNHQTSEAEKAARNALALNPIAELATNADNLAMIDTHFRTASRPRASPTSSSRVVAGSLLVLMSCVPR